MAPEKSEKALSVDDLTRWYGELAARVTDVRRGL
jgi:hypothetical protein